MLSWRLAKEKVMSGVMFFITCASLLLVVAMGIGLCLRSSPILSEISLWDILSANEWKPAKNQFGFFPFIMGTVCVTGISIVLALPVSLFTALFLTEYSHSQVRKFVYPVLDILAALPSVIYCVWGTLIVVPWISGWLAPRFVSEYTSGYTVLAAGTVLAIMILPLLVSMFVEIFSTVPGEMREAAYALGSTRWQLSRRVVMKKSLPGIFATVVLAVSRALGETIAVLMVCGNLPQVPRSLFDACYPLPALIANNYGEMMSMPLYEAALMLAAAILFIVVLLFNLLSRIILKRVED